MICFMEFREGDEFFLPNIREKGDQDVSECHLPVTCENRNNLKVR